MSTTFASAARSQFDSLQPAHPMDRRTFVATLGAAGFALAVQPVHASTVIHTDEQGLTTGSTSIKVKDDSLPIYFARPQGDARVPVVLVIQEIFGVHEHIADVCRRLAKAGYLAIAPELFFRQGDPRTLDSIPAILEKIVSRVPDAQVMQDLDACAAWAETQGADAGRLGVTGFCWGGRITWLYAAHNPEVKAAIAWYGRLKGPTDPLHPVQPIDVPEKLHAPVLGLYGGDDAGIPLTDVDAMRAALQAATNPHARASEFVVYPEAPHAFHADYRPSYRKADAEDGWKRMLQWCAERLQA